MGEMFDIPVGDLEWPVVIESVGDGQIVATVRQLTGEERDSCLSISGDIELDRQKMVRLGLVKIEGLSVGGKAIVTADDLLKSRQKELYAIMQEIFLAINRGSQLSEEESKN